MFTEELVADRRMRSSGYRPSSLQYESVEGRAESLGLQSGEEACYVVPTDDKDTSIFKS
jgi:hypothetical protein